MTINKMFYHDMYMQFNIKYVKNKINLVTAPCGAGKTYHCNEIIKKYDRTDRDCYYVTDTRMLKESVQRTLPNNVKVITYQTLGIILADVKKCEQFKTNTHLLILDEAHQLYRYARRYNTGKINESERYYEVVKVELYYLPKYMKVIALTGTPGDLIREAKDVEGKKLINDVLTEDMIDLLHCQEYDEEKSVINMYDYLDKEFKLKDGKKALGYTGTVRELKIYQTLLESKGYRVMSLWSLNNINNEMSDKQKEFYNYIKDANKLPNDIDILLINSAYESGWNLENEGSNYIQTVFINTSDSVTATQVVNRVRHNVELMVTTVPRLRDSDFYNYDWTRRQIDKIDRTLALFWYSGILETKYDRDVLCDTMCLIDERRRIMKQINTICKYMYRLNIAHFYHSNKSVKYMTLNQFEEEVYNNYYKGETIFNYELTEVVAYRKGNRVIKGAWLICSKREGVFTDEDEVIDQSKSKYDIVQALKATGITQNKVVEVTGYSSSTVKRYWKVKR